MRHVVHQQRRKRQRCTLELVARLLQRFGIAALRGLLGLGERLFQVQQRLFVEARSCGVHVLLDRLHHRSDFNDQVGSASCLKVILGMFERARQHAFHLGIGESMHGLHIDGGRRATRLFLGGDGQHSIRVDVEAYADTRHACRHGRDPAQLETSQAAAIGGEFALALHDVEVDGGLVVDVGSEAFGRRARHGRVALNDLRHRAAHRLDAERKRGHIQQQHIALASDQDVRLYGSPQRHNFIGIELGVRLAAKELFDARAHRRDARAATNQDHFVNCACRELGIRESLGAGGQGAIDQGLGQRVKLRAVQLTPPSDAALGQHQVDLGAWSRRELDLAAFAGQAQRLLEACIGQHLVTVLGRDFALGQVHQRGVEVITAQVRVTCS